MFENIYENGTDGMLIQIHKNITNYKKESEV